MPVDRAKRDAVAEALASYLRGEKSRDQVGMTICHVFPNDNPASKVKSGNDAYLEEMQRQWPPPESRMLFSKELWSRWCRHLAFLNTEFATNRCPMPAFNDEDLPWEILLARWHMLGLLVAGGVAYFTSWWFFAVVVFLSYVLFMASKAKHDAPAEMKRAKDMKRRLEYYPFADEQDWLAHEHLLASYDLPAYDATLFNESLQRKEPSAWKAALMEAAIRVLFLVFQIMTITIWPLFIVLMALSRRKVSDQQTP